MNRAKEDNKTEFQAKYSNVKKTFLEWSKSVDINCYNKMLDYSGNYSLQFVWFVILLGSTGATFYLISTSIMDYLKFEVTSQIQIVNEIPAKFPTITFCDNNPFSSVDSIDYLNNISISNNVAVSDLIFYYAKHHASSRLIDDEQRKLFMSWSFRMCYVYNKNCDDNLHWYWSYEYGNCFQFNSGFNVTNQRIDFVNVKREGKDFGVQIDWLPLINRNKYVTTRARGLVVFVHNNSFKPSEAFFVESGKMTYIAVKRKVTQKYPWPYSDCIDLNTYKSDLFDYIKNSNKTYNTYRQQDCFELCIQKTIIDSCKCYYTKYDDLGTNVTACLNDIETDCLEEQIDAFNIEACQANSCPLECDSVTYDLSFSNLEYYDELTYETEIGNDQDIKDMYALYNLTLSYELFKSSCVLFTIYYPSLKYEQISESPKTQIIDLFTQIGGALGMFVSFSIFTIFELIEIFLLILKDFLIGPKAKILNFYT
jgi:hypothetical protein